MINIPAKSKEQAALYQFLLQQVAAESYLEMNDELATLAAKRAAAVALKQANPNAIGAFAPIYEWQADLLVSKCVEPIFLRTHQGAAINQRTKPSLAAIPTKS